MTNGERIRNMTDKELAEFLCEYDACNMCEADEDTICYEYNCNEVAITEAWLKEEVGGMNERIN